MGLDTVELVISVEEIFDIKISNESAAKLTTVGELHQYVVEELMRLQRADVNREVVYSTLRNIICFQLDVKPEAVVPAARFVQDLHAD